MGLIKALGLERWIACVRDFREEEFGCVQVLSKDLWFYQRKFALGIFQVMDGEPKGFFGHKFSERFYFFGLK